LGWLKSNGIQLACATNSIRKTAQTMLDYAGLTNFLDVLVTNEDVINAKPNPEIYLKTCELINVSPSQTLVFEDNQNGIQAAREAGCNVVEVKSPDDVGLDTYLNFIKGGI
jgi:HAD superfamily hydrolase (TIGR01509 family)